MAKLFDDQGLTASDRAFRSNLADAMGLVPDEMQSLTKMLSAWHKGPNAVIKQCQRVFNLMRRLQCADEYGYCTCVSTGERQHYKKMDAGHFIGADRPATRFEVGNVYPQTKQANNHKLGDDAKIEYTLWMVDSFGHKHVRDLIRKGQEKKSWLKSKHELLKMRIEWQREINRLEKVVPSE